MCCRASLDRMDECVRPYPSCGALGFVAERELRKVFPEELAAVDHFSPAHVEQVYCQHAVLEVIAEYVGIIAFGCGDALTLLQLFDCRDQVAVARCALVFLCRGC